MIETGDSEPCLPSSSRGIVRARNSEPADNGVHQPMVSVVIPTHNCAPYVEEAIRSVLSQSYSNKEVVIVDDGSTDDTHLRMSSFGESIRVIRQRNAGPAAARNRGVSAARGEYVAFLDGDDVWLPGKLDAQMRYLTANPDVRLVYGGFSLWRADAAGRYPPAESLGDESSDGDGAWIPAGYLYSRLLLDSVICIITTVIHRSVFDTLRGFDESLRTGEDYDFWIRASRQYPAHELKRKVALYRVHSESSTRVPRATSSEYAVLRRALEKYGMAGPDGAVVDQSLVDARLAKLCFDHGYMHFWRGEPSIAAKAFVQANRHGAFSVRTMMYAGVSYVRSCLSSARGASR